VFRTALLSQFFYGYEVSWLGQVVAAFWAFIAGFVAGWFLGFMKNLFTAFWMFGLRVKSSLTQPFLDHI
jgi:ABC-type dipeptide/oligopeptide/nickel transport system permease subunit